MLHSEGFATEADAAALLGLDSDGLRAKIAERSVFALPEPRTGAYRIPVWALHLDTIGLPTLRLHAIDPQIDPWEIHAFMSTPNGSLHGRRPFECLVDGEHLPLKLRALRDALVIKPVRPRKPRARVYGDDLLPALGRCWVLLRAPAGKILAPFMPVLVPLLRAEGEITLTDDQARLLAGISAATIDRMLTGERRRMTLRGRSRTKDTRVNKYV